MKAFVFIAVFLAFVYADEVKDAYDVLYKGFKNNAFSASAVMAYIKIESSFNPKALEKAFAKKKGYTNESYTKAVDKNTYKNFATDKAGYGYLQWAVAARKRNLLNFAKGKPSIGSSAVQIEFILKELQTGYKSCFQSLTKAKSIDDAVDAIYKGYIKLASIKSKALTYAKEFYSKYAKASSTSSSTSSTSSTSGADKRQKVINVMRSWIDITDGSSGHKNIINTYNQIKPLPNGFKMDIYNSWCATTVSAAFHKAGLDSIFPSECSCQRMVKKAQTMGIWQENDAYVPSPGDVIVYDFDSEDEGDSKGWADHVGLVEKVEGDKITLIEGNIGNPSHVGRRTIEVDYWATRGFITPKFK